MKKITYAVKRLATEYKNMHKPGGRELIKDSLKITCTAVACALILKVIDTGFGALLGLIL